MPAAADGADEGVREQITMVSLEVETIRELFLQLDSKVVSESNFRQQLEADFEERIRAADYDNFTSELASACEELQAWRDGIEAERASFKTKLKKEMMKELREEQGDDNGLRKALDDEVRNRVEAINGLELKNQDVHNTLGVEIESRSNWTQNLREILQGEGEERSRLFQCVENQGKLVQSLEDQFSAHVQELQYIKSAVGNSNAAKFETLSAQSTSHELTAEKLESLSSMSQSQEDSKMLQEHWAATYTALTEEVNKLSEQVKEAPQVLLELTIQLQSLQQQLTSETNERNIAIDNFDRKLDLVNTVFNVESKTNISNVENAGMSSQSSNQIGEQLKQIFDQLDSLANNQLSAMREQIATCNQQIIMEQAERKSDSEMVWSTMQSLHGHLVQFISQPPTQSTTYVMPESQRSLGRMPRSRSPSPRIPPTLPEDTYAARPRTLVQLPQTQLPNALAQGPNQLLRSAYPAVQGQPSSASGSMRAPMGIGGAQMSFNQLSGDAMTPGQNISFARHLLKS